MKHRAQRGSVLIFTLWLAAGLAAAALLVGHTGMLHYRREASAEVLLSADLATDGAMRYVQQVLTAAGAAGTLPDLAKYQAEDLAIGDCRVWILGHADDVAADAPVFGLTDEGGKLNLNTATLEMLQALPGMSIELAAAIVDWRDTDSDLTPYGAESETYAALNPAYTAKNGPFETVDELRLVYGALPLLLEGRDRNRNTLLESWERTLVESAREQLTTVPDIGILEHVTVATREPNTRTRGGDRVSIFRMTAGELRRNLAAELSISLTRVLEIARAAGIGDGFNEVQFRSIFELCVKGKLTAAEADLAWERFTVTPGTVIRGRVNVNTAGAAVLACLPGLDEAKAATLVAYRKQNASASAVCPLWVKDAIGEDAAIAAGPYLTTRSYQVVADIVAVGPHGRGLRRTRCVFDTSTGTPVVVSRRDLSHLGWPLGDAIYKSITGRARESFPAGVSAGRGASAQASDRRTQNLVENLIENLVDSRALRAESDKVQDKVVEAAAGDSRPPFDGMALVDATGGRSFPTAGLCGVRKVAGPSRSGTSRGGSETLPLLWQPPAGPHAGVDPRRTIGPRNGMPLYGGRSPTAVSRVAAADTRGSAFHGKGVG